MFDFGNFARALVEAFKTIAYTLWRALRWLYNHFISFAKFTARNPEWGVTSICLAIAWLAP